VLQLDALRAAMDAAADPPSPGRSTEDITAHLTGMGFTPAAARLGIAKAEEYVERFKQLMTAIYDEMPEDDGDPDAKYTDEECAQRIGLTTFLANVAHATGHQAVEQDRVLRMMGVVAADERGEGLPLEAVLRVVGDMRIRRQRESGESSE